MEKELEVEYKSVLTADKYQELLGLIPQFAEKKDSYEQVNYFFDTSDRLLDKKCITLRIRQKKNTWQLTAKIKQKTADVRYTSNQELNEMISEEKAKEYLKKGIDVNEPVLCDMLALAGINEPVDFQLLGSLTTYRTDFAFYDDTISLDRNTYNEQLDYELEWESTNHSFLSFINQRSLYVEFNNASGKRKRFLKTLTP